MRMNYSNGSASLMFIRFHQLIFQLLQFLYQPVAWEAAMPTVLRPSVGTLQLLWLTLAGINLLNRVSHDLDLRAF